MTITVSATPRGDEDRAAIAAAPKRRRTVLLVEPEPEVAERLVEAVWAFGGLEPIHVEDRERALAALAEHRVEVVVAEAVLPDGNGFRLLADLRGSASTRDVPFVFLTDDARVKAKIAAFRLGAHDYLVKPVAVGELCARVAAAARRVEEARTAAVDRGFSLAGSFAGMSLSELVGLLNSGRRSGRLSIETPKARGQLLLVEGQIYHVAYGDQWGEEAFYAVLFEGEGRFEFLPERLDRNAVPNTIALSPTALLVEGARRLDEAVRNGTAPATVREVRAQSAPAPDQELARRLCADLDEAGGRAAIEVRDLGEIDEWTAESGADDRLLGCVVGDARRFGAWLAEAGECSIDALFANALDSGPKAPCVSWEFADGRGLDVLLLDHRAPGAVIEAVRRQFAFAIVAPPQGRWRDLGIRGRAELSTLVARMRPRAVVGVGVAGLLEKLVELVEQVDVPATCGMLDDGGSLLGWLRDAVTRWGGVD